MNISQIPAGNNPPHEINVVIEIPGRSEPVKYELDKESGAIFVDRIQENSMCYPHPYGFIPNTNGDDGDPLDVMVICGHKLMPGVVISARPIGVLNMEDDGGEDAKIIAVPGIKICKRYANVKTLQDLPASMLREIEFFFSRYKDVEDGKWTKVKGFDDEKAAEAIIKRCIL